MESPPKENNSDYELVQYSIYSTLRARLWAHKVNASSTIFSLLSDRRYRNVNATLRYVKDKYSAP